MSASSTPAKQQHNRTSVQQQKSISFDDPEPGDLESELLDVKRVSFDQRSFVDEPPVGFSTPKPEPRDSGEILTAGAGESSGIVETIAKDPDLEVTDEQLLEQQTLKEGENQPETVESPTQDIREALSISRTDLSSRDFQSSSVTGLPSHKEVDSPVSEHDFVALASQHSGSNSNDRDRDSVTSGESATSRQRHSSGGMGASESKGPERNLPRNIMSEEPADMLLNRKKVSQSEVTGNCRPWSDHVYYKLFMDVEGRNATLMVLKCEISYVDVFTDEEHSLYKSRFIGGKSDGVAQMFVFDLMKANWEEKIPKSQAIELNVDIVMSSSPIHYCSETLLNLIQLEKTYLKHRNFDGQLNVMVRFAHGYGWDIKDDAIRTRVHTGLRNLFREGVNLEVMSADTIMEEMRVDGILATDDVQIKHYLSKRQAWTGQPIRSPDDPSRDDQTPAISSSKRHRHDYGSGDASRDVTLTSLSAKRGGGSSLATMTDEYYVYLHTGLWNIIQDTKRIQDILNETLEDF